MTSGLKPSSCAHIRLCSNMAANLSLALRLLTRKLGTLSPALTAKVNALSLQGLEALGRLCVILPKLKI
jgi:Domain of unknown function (DUF4351)